MNDSLIYRLNIKIDHIMFRIKTIQDTYNKINNLNLKKRLILEHIKLNNDFIEIKSNISLLEKSSPEKYSLSKLLAEKYIRYEKEIFNNKYLFFA